MNVLAEVRTWLRAESFSRSRTTISAMLTKTLLVAPSNARG
jgi:hypothetical protein